MTVTLPDTPALADERRGKIRLGLACSLFARGKVSSRVAADIAGVTYGRLLDALHERKIPYLTSEMLRQDIETLNRMFPGHPLPLPSA